MSSPLKKLLSAVLLFSFIFVQSPQRVSAQEVNGGQLAEEIVTDLLAGGVSAIASMSGNVPLGMAAGFLTKYLSTYGIKGVKALVELIRGKPPQDLGEINIYYIYLLHVKRNLFQTMINIRASVRNQSRFENIENELIRLSEYMVGKCQEEGGCEVDSIEEDLINFTFLNIAVDAQQSIEVSKYLAIQEIRSTYQYLMLLYMDIVMVEQKLMESQYNVLASTSFLIMKELNKNEFISNEEKEFQSQLLLNMVLRWELNRDHRRTILFDTLKEPLENLQDENDELEDEIDEYNPNPRRRRA